MTGVDPLAPLRAMLADYPRRLAEATERAQALAEETVTGYSPDESVAVDALGTGRIVAVRLLVPRRELDTQTLGEAVTFAANAALDAVERRRDDLRRELTTEQAGANHGERFTETMNALLTRVDRLSSRLDAQLAELKGPTQPPE